jgi:uncharacterized coiled-coil DUF342 family protein
MDWTKFGEYGLLGLIVGAIIILLFLVVKWTLATTKDILAQSAKEREDYYNKMGNISSQMQKVCDCIDKHDEKADERGRYVREEHRQMIEILGRMNGYRKPT